MKVWTAEVIRVLPGETWIEVKAPWDLPEGGRSLKDTRVVYRGREWKVRGWHADPQDLTPIPAGHPVKIDLGSE